MSISKRVFQGARWAMLMWLGAWSMVGADFPGSSSESPQSDMPIGLSVLVPTPVDNPWTSEKIDLGRRLFFDDGLSGDGTVACASCHSPDLAFTDGRAKAVGISKQSGRRNAPSLHNIAFRRSLFWDGRRGSLEEQALDPITNPVEMGNTLRAVVEYLTSDAEYPEMFERAYGSPNITLKRISQALASYERSLFSGGSAYDRYVTLNDDSALSESARRGLSLFTGKARCSHCHDQPFFTDQRFHNTGVSWGQEPLDQGRYEQTGKEKDKGRFKVPSLRDISRTAPYMHDGSMKTLEAVVEFYSRGGNSNPFLDKTIKPLHLTERDVEDLIEFLQSLTDERFMD